MDVFCDRRLPGYFRHRRWSDVRLRRFDEDSAFGDFLNERVGVISGYDLSGVDLDFLATVDFPQTWEFKKLQVNELLADGDAPTKRMVLEQGFSGDGVAYERFVEQVRALQRICDDLLESILPVPPDAVLSLTRFSETRMENLHYDLDAHSDDHEAFRLYINLDRAPRIWATSYQMSELLTRGGTRLVQGIDTSQPAETMLKRAATRAYGGWHQRATERLAPRHFVYIDPGDIFFLDGRCVSHQVMAGHRVFTVYARLSHARNPEMRPTFAAKLRTAFEEATRVPLGAESAIVNYYEPVDITNASQVREDWTTVFGDARTGQIRRFDDTGMVQE